MQRVSVFVWTICSVHQAYSTSKWPRAIFPMGCTSGGLACSGGHLCCTMRPSAAPALPTSLCARVLPLTLSFPAALHLSGTPLLQAPTALQAVPGYTTLPPCMGREKPKGDWRSCFCCWTLHLTPCGLQVACGPPIGQLWCT